MGPRKTTVNLNWSYKWDSGRKLQFFKLLAHQYKDLRRPNVLFPQALLNFGCILKSVLKRVLCEEGKLRNLPGVIVSKGFTKLKKTWVFWNILRKKIVSNFRNSGIPDPESGSGLYIFRIYLFIFFFESLHQMDDL